MMDILKMFAAAIVAGIVTLFALMCMGAMFAIPIVVIVWMIRWALS